MPHRQYAVYIMTNAAHTVLYTGVTNNLLRRITEHKSGKGGGFTARYKVTQLVYFELGDDIRQALAREKQIKAGSRQHKLDLIEQLNSAWKDLSAELLGEQPEQ